MRDELLSGAAHPPPGDDAPAPRRRGRRASPASPSPDDPLLTSREGAAEVHLSLAAFWRAVAAGRLPRPVYPQPRSPRWRRSELVAALEATRAQPAEAKAARLAARLAQRRSA